MRISFKQLEIFLAIAKIGNMSQAAEILFLTQSACSMALSTLENQLGSPLFDRYGKKLLLNERGRALFPKAANIVTEMNELQDLMLIEKEGALAGHLIVGASTTIGNYVLPKLIGNYVTVFPKTKITLQVGNTEQIIQSVLKFSIDLGMIEGNCYSDNIESQFWKKDELVIIASPTHPLSKKTKITRSDLQAARWLLRESGSGTREKFEEAMGGKINSFLELGHTEAIKQAVQTGLGISCLSKTAVAELLDEGRLVELQVPFLKLTRNFYIIFHKEKYKTAVLNGFIKTCKSL